MRRAAATAGLLSRGALLFLLLLFVGRAGAARPAACADDDVRPLCLAAGAFAAVATLPADERASVVATLLAVHLHQHVDPPPPLAAAAARFARSGSTGERLQVLLPLAEQTLRKSGKAAAQPQLRQVGSLLASLAAGRSRPQNYLQIADACVGLTEIHGGVPVLVPAWAKLYARYCRPEFFARLRVADGFTRVVRSHLQLVGSYLVVDRAGFAAGLPEVILTLRAVIASLDQAELPAAEREAGVVVAGAMQVSLGTLACLLELTDECQAILLGGEVPDAVADPVLWSSWAAIVAVRGEGLAAGGRGLDGIGALNWLLARATEPEYRSHRAVFLASAAWLADRLEALRAGRRSQQVA